MAVPTAEIFGPRWHVELPDSPAASLAIDHQRAKKPVPHTAEIAGSRGHIHPVCHRGSLPGQAIGADVGQFEVQSAIWSLLEPVANAALLLTEYRLPTVRPVMPRPFLENACPGQIGYPEPLA